MNEEPASKGLSRRGKAAVVVFLGGLLATAVVVRLSSQSGAVTPAECQATLAAAGGLAAFAKGDVAIFRPARLSENLGDLVLHDGDGQRLTLTAFAGRTILVNFWATWCVPCRAEMPALDRLEAQRGGADFEVVAINMDVDSTPEKERAFLGEIGATHLKFYADPNLALAGQLRRRALIFGLPTTILVDAKGCRLGTADGGAAWDSADAHALVTAALKAS
jgi:thiol-disulfide isomerase/thioredoxin